MLTVDERFYEEKLDSKLEKLLPINLRIEKVNAYNLSKSRIVGDIGLRAFFQLYKRARQLIQSEKIDFLFIPIPSFYIALLGRWLHHSTNIRYGIDYIDPWVHSFPGSEKFLSRHWFSTKLAKLLEPIAVKKASLITGVAEGYYKGVIERNPGLLKHCVFGAMPYGGEAQDHEKIKELNIAPYLFPATSAKIRLVYAGAMLPKAYKPLELIFQAIKNNPSVFNDVEFHFIGTGKTPDDTKGFNIKPLAEKYGLWHTNVYEYPRRIPYLDVLAHLHAASGVFILGSTEPHYTPSKVYQGVLSQKPVLAVLHTQSTAVNILRTSGAGIVLDFDGENDVKKIERDFINLFSCYTSFTKSFTPASVDLNVFQENSAEQVTKKLVTLLEKIRY